MGFALCSVSSTWHRALQTLETMDQMNTEVNLHAIPQHRSYNYPVFPAKKLRPRRLRNVFLDPVTNWWDRTGACPELQSLKTPGFLPLPGVQNPAGSGPPGLWFTLCPETTHCKFSPCIFPLEFCFCLAFFFFFSTLPILPSHVCPCSPQPERHRRPGKTLMKNEGVWRYVGHTHNHTQGKPEAKRK